MGGLPQDYDYNSMTSKIARNMMRPGQGDGMQWPQTAVGGQVPVAPGMPGGQQQQQQQMPPMGEQPMPGRQGPGSYAQPMPQIGQPQGQQLLMPDNGGHDLIVRQMMGRGR